MYIEKNNYATLFLAQSNCDFSVRADPGFLPSASIFVKAQNCLLELRQKFRGIFMVFEAVFSLCLLRDNTHVIKD